jgi:hypothetical protein
MDPTTLDPNTLDAFQKLWAMLGIDFGSTVTFSVVVWALVAGLKSSINLSGWKTHVAAVTLSAILAINGYIVASSTPITFGSWVGVLFSTLFCWVIPMGAVEGVKHLISKHGDAVGTGIANAQTPPEPPKP